jgi:hypothetical protein
MIQDPDFRHPQDIETAIKTGLQRCVESIRRDEREQAGLAYFPLRFTIRWTQPIGATDFCRAKDPNRSFAGNPEKAAACWIF